MADEIDWSDAEQRLIPALLRQEAEQELVRVLHPARQAFASCPKKPPECNDHGEHAAWLARSEAEQTEMARGWALRRAMEEATGTGGRDGR